MSGAHIRITREDGPGETRQTPQTRQVEGGGEGAWSGEGVDRAGGGGAGVGGVGRENGLKWSGRSMDIW